MYSNTINTSEFIPALKKDGVGIVYTALAAPPLSYPNAKSFIEKYQAQYKIEPTGNSVLGFDTMKTVLQGLRDAISQHANTKLPTRAEVMYAIRHVNIGSKELMSGGISFNQIGDRTEATVFVLRVGEDGVARVNMAIKVKQP
jgi:branched-chain amino acid transport system substrate-binding protein